MSYKSFSYHCPWDKGSQSKSLISSSLYSFPQAPPSGKKILKTASSSSFPDSSRRIDLTQVSSINTELLEVRSQEREQLVDLNDRFATYIEKVRRLELQNMALS